MPRVGALIIGLLLSTALSAAEPAPQPVRSLEYGEALFYYFQRDYLDAGVRLMAAQQRRRLGVHDQDADLLLGGLQLSYGMPDAAQRTFEKALNASVNPVAKNRAWYALARMAYRRGYWQRANQALARIDQPDAAQAGKTALLQGLVDMAQQQPARAVEALERGGEQQAGAGPAYLQYNLGVALMRADRRPEGLALLDRLGQQKVVGEEQATVRDYANLAGAFALLQTGRPQDAQRFFNRVRLTGPVSNLALLGAGWAASDAGQFSAALTPWRELVRRIPRDAPVLEALIAVPYAYTQLNDVPHAAGGYEAAVEAYQQERSAIAKAIAAVDDPQWMLDAGELANAATRGGQAPVEGQWMPHLIAGHAFQEAWRTYQDLRELDRNLAHWQESLAAYDTMLAARKARFDLVVPKIEKRLAELDVQGLKQRRAALRRELQKIVDAKAVWKLATDQENESRSEIEALAARMAKLPRSEEKAALQDRLRRVRGLLYWEVHAAFPDRRWQATKAVNSLDAPLAKVQQHIVHLRGARAYARARVGDLGARIASARARILRQQPRVKQALVRQRAYVERLARKELGNRQAQIDSYLLQARFALARLYDRAQSGAAAQ